MSKTTSDILSEVIVFSDEEGMVFLNSLQCSELKKHAHVHAYVGGVPNPEELSGHAISRIIISSNTLPFIQETYYVCILRGYKNISIYNIKRGEFSTYGEICMELHGEYENIHHILYRYNKSVKANKARENFLQSDDLFSNIQEIDIMLSNLCNYASLHRKCPLSSVSQKEIMPKAKVLKILDELSASNYQNEIAFHVYNEPLIDPRLFMFISYAKNSMPNCSVRILSNGYYLTQCLVDELKEVGVDILETTAYGRAEYERLLTFDVDFPYDILWGDLDNRLNLYEERKEPICSGKPCPRLALLQTDIYSNGDVGLCCLDYRHSYNLGNVFTDTLKSVMQSTKMISIQKELLKGNRSMFDMCKNCSW